MRTKLEEYEAGALALAASSGLPGIEFVVLELTPVPHMDSMGAAFLEELWRDYAARGIQLVGGCGGWLLGGRGWRPGGWVGGVFALVWGLCVCVCVCM